MDLSFGSKLHFIWRQKSFFAEIFLGRNIQLKHRGTTRVGISLLVMFRKYIDMQIQVAYNVNRGEGDVKSALM